MRGKPVYTEGLAEALCAGVAEGKGVTTMCTELNLPRRTVRSWEALRPAFAAELHAARMQGLERIADEIIEISDAAEGLTDNAAVQAARLRVDSRRWVLSKLAPERYGDRVELSGAAGTALFPSNHETRLPQLLVILSSLLPNMNNSELFGLARGMVEKLKRLDAPDDRPPKVLNGTSEDN